MENHLTDEQIALKTIEDKESFGILIDRYQDKLLRYILKSTNIAKEDAEDVLQEVFIKAYTHIQDFDPSLSFSSWIYRITHNHVISHHRKRIVRPEGHAYTIDETLMQTLASDLATDARIHQAFTSKELQTILDQLPAKYRDVLVLKYLEEKEYQEISDILQKPIGTVGTLLNRAKKKAFKLAQS